MPEWTAIKDLVRTFFQKVSFTAENLLQVAASVVPGTGWVDSGLAKEAGGNLADIAARLIDGASSVAALLTAISGKLPATLGAKEAAASVSVTPASTIGAARTTAAIVSAASAGDNVLVATDGAKVVKVYRLMLVFAGATTAIIKQGSTALTGTMSFTEGGALVLDFSDEPWFTGAAGAAINLTLGSAVQVSGRIQYTQA